MADLTSFDLFCAENSPLMEQLKPFRYYDDASRKKLLENAWTKLGGKNKQYYVKKALKRLINVRFSALKNMGEIDTSKDGNDDAFEIYRTEMRLILLQDPVFVKEHYHELQAVIQEGWKGLNGIQRLDFYERAVLAKELCYTEKAEEKQTSDIKTKIFGSELKCFDKNYLHKLHSLRFPQNPKIEWLYHSYRILTNPIDCAAFEEFAINVHAEEPSLVGRAIWGKWMDLSHDERESYYRKAFETAALIDADTLFVMEKQTIVRCNGCDWKALSAEQKELQQAWNDISEEAKKVYIDRALNDCLERDQNPKTRFVGFYDFKRDKLMARLTTIDDVNAELTPHIPLSFVTSDEVEDAFIVYMEKMRPELLKQPEMIQKRFWEVNLVLWKKWYALSKEEQQVYYDLVRRFLHIQKNLNGWQLEAWKVFGEDYGHRYQFAKLDEEAKQRCGEKALQNRKILLKKFPDLHDFFCWTTPELSMDADVSVSTFTSSSKNDLKTASEQLSTPYSPKYDYLMYTDVSDIDAFEEYQKDVQAMVSKYITVEVWWQHFLNLTDEERNVYYDKAIKTKAEKQARILFAKENCTVTKKSTEDETFANEMVRLNEEWKTLSAPAKNYYVEVAEKELMKREKEKPEDYYFKCETVSYFDIKLDNIPSDCNLVPRYGNVNPYSTKPEEDAFVIYLQKHFAELYSQPGMADKRYFQLCLILEQRYMNMSDEERQIYLDIVQEVKTIYSETQNLPVTLGGVFYRKFKTTKQLENAKSEEKAVCEKEAKQNLKKMMEKFPALTEHFQWMVYRQPSTKPQAETSTNVETAMTEEPTVTTATTEETPKEAETSCTWEVVNDDIAEPTIATETINENDHSAKTVSAEVHEPAVDSNTSEDASSATWEVVKEQQSNQEEAASKSVHTEAIKFAIHGDESESDIIAALEETATLRKALEETDTLRKALGLSPLSVDDVQESLLNANNAKESESTATWEVVDDEKNTDEDTSLKSTKEPETSTSSAQAKKTPTAFMFYKKAMRRLNANQNFGKKDNESQRKALIAGWKKLSDEEKAVYFEKELLASL